MRSDEPTIFCFTDSLTPHDPNECFTTAASDYSLFASSTGICLRMYHIFPGVLAPAVPPRGAVGCLLVYLCIIRRPALGPSVLSRCGADILYELRV